MYSFTHKGIIFYLLQDDFFNQDIFSKEFSSYIPGTITNEFNRIFKLKSGEFKEHGKSSISETTKEKKMQTSPHFTLTSMKNYMKLARKDPNPIN